jgi:hypothetical protein
MTDPDWPKWYAAYMVQRMHEAGWEVDYLPDLDADRHSYVEEALTGPMGRIEEDAAKARSYNPRGVPIKPNNIYQGDYRNRAALGITDEEYLNAFGVTSQRKD